MFHAYTDTDGNITTVASDAPGIMFVPDGFSESDAVHITTEEYRELQTVQTSQPALSQLEVMQQQIDDLRKAIEELQDRLA